MIQLHRQPSQNEAYPCENREEREGNRRLHVACSNWRIFTLAPLVRQIAKTNEVQKSPKSREAQISQDIMLPCLYRGHLLKQVLSSQKSNRCKECNDTNASSIVASIAIFVVETILFASFLLLPSLR